MAIATNTFKPDTAYVELQEFQKVRRALASLVMAVESTDVEGMPHAYAGGDIKPETPAYLDAKQALQDTKHLDWADPKAWEKSPV